MFAVKKAPVAVLGIGIGIGLAMVGKAADSELTRMVEGRAPVATNVVAVPGPTGTRTITGSYVFSDADGDAENGTTYRWLRNGAYLSGATTSTIAPTVAGIGTDLMVFEVTPGTDWDTSEPAEGLPVRSAEVHAPGGTILNRIVRPVDRGRFTYTDAVAHCASKGGGARLPTRAELLEIYLEGTRAENETSPGEFSDICTIHGLPDGYATCGGDYSWWSNEEISATHTWVRIMVFSKEEDGFKGNRMSAVCIR